MILVLCPSGNFLAIEVFCEINQLLVFYVLLSQCDGGSQQAQGKGERKGKEIVYTGIYAVLCGYK